MFNVKPCLHGTSIILGFHLSNDLASNVCERSGLYSMNHLETLTVNVRFCPPESKQRMYKWKREIKKLNKTNTFFGENM